MARHIWARTAPIATDALCVVLFYLGGVGEGEMFRIIRVAEEEVVHIVVGHLLQLCLANISQEIHGERHPYTTDSSEKKQCSGPQNQQK